MEDIRHSKKMIEIKEKNPDLFKFYLEVGWAKIALMEDEMEEGLDYYIGLIVVFHILVYIREGIIQMMIKLHGIVNEQI